MKYIEVKCGIAPFSPEAADVLSAMLSEIGFEAFTPTDDGLTAYIQKQAWSEEAMRQVVDGFFLPDVSIRYEAADAPDEDWNQVWEEEGFQPVVIPQASPCPSKGGENGDGTGQVTPPLEGQGEAVLIVIHDVKHTDVPPAQYDIVITPRLAFGTGSHQTTRLILRLLARLDLHGQRVIDAGTGTGILSIMAIKRGAKDVLAYDIDQWSVDNTRDNLILNGIYGNVTVLCGDSSVLEGCAKADLLIANINRNILLRDLPRFAESVRQGGRIILSGFYLQDVEALSQAARAYGLTPTETISEGEWAAMVISS